ncbi:hypothetical protein GCM10009830_09370 [Glycomyces endophyticus]|uniref:Integral membrane protein n=1 Tax=Glycomyces endophyticus TaxID=480996 RepID=A0ABP4S1H8_9ACTN
MLLAQLLFVIPVLPLAAVVVLIAILVGLRRGAVTAPVAWRSAGTAVLCALVLVCWFGIGQTAVIPFDTDDACVLNGLDGDFLRSEESLIPLRSDLVCGGVRYEMVPGWVNPTMAVLLVAAAVCFAAALRRRARSTPATGV